MSMFMCLRYDSLRGLAPIGCPVFFPIYRLALDYATKKAVIMEEHRFALLNTEYFSPKCVFYVKIFEIPFGYNIPIHHHKDAENYELYEMCMKTVYDRETTAVMIIQRKWRTIYNTRFAAAVIIRKRMKHAIANPYTQLCRNRLNREFNQMMA